MSTESILQQIFWNELAVLSGAAALVGFTVLALDYVFRRWSFIPRRKQRAMFGERI